MGAARSSDRPMCTLFLEGRCGDERGLRCEHFGLPYFRHASRTAWPIVEGWCAVMRTNKDSRCTKPWCLSFHGKFVDGEIKPRVPDSARDKCTVCLESIAQQWSVAEEDAALDAARADTPKQGEGEADAEAGGASGDGGSGGGAEHSNESGDEGTTGHGGASGGRASGDGASTLAVRKLIIFPSCKHALHKTCYWKWLRSRIICAIKSKYETSIELLPDARFKACVAAGMMVQEQCPLCAGSPSRHAAPISATPSWVAYEPDEDDERRRRTMNAALQMAIENVDTSVEQAECPWLAADLPCPNEAAMRELGKSDGDALCFMRHVGTTPSNPMHAAEYLEWKFGFDIVKIGITFPDSEFSQAPHMEEVTPGGDTSTQVTFYADLDADANASVGASASAVWTEASSATT